MLVRLPIAFGVGFAIYLVAMAMTAYDGSLSIIFQPIIGSILTAMALVALLVVGSPLLIGPVWNLWRQAGWFALIVSVAGIGLLIASWHPSFRVKVFDPELQMMVDSFHPVLSIVGWLAALFGILFCPAIGLRGDRRWM